MLVGLAAWLTFMVGTSIVNQMTNKKIKKYLDKRGYSEYQMGFYFPAIFYVLGPIAFGMAISNYRKCEQLIEQVLTNYEKKQAASGANKPEFNYPSAEEDKDKDKTLVLQYWDQKISGDILYVVQNDLPIIVGANGDLSNMNRKEQYEMIQHSYQDLKDTLKESLQVEIGELLEPEKPIYNPNQLLESREVDIVPEQYLLIGLTAAGNYLKEEKQVSEAPKTYRKK